MPKTRRKKELWYVLSNVSHIWRSAALACFCREATLKISTETGQSSFEFPDMPCPAKRNAVHFRHVKKVSITFSDINKQPSGKQLQDLFAAWPENLVFPSAHILAVNVDHLKVDASATNKLVKNKALVWIAERIRMAMPKLQEVDLGGHRDSNAIAGSLLEGAKWKADTLLPIVLGMATHLKLYTRPIYFDDGYPSLQNFSGLTHLDYDYKDNGEFAGYLIQRSAPTLEVLKVTRFLMNLVKHLVLRDDNTPIEYPRLQKLCMSMYDFSMHRDKFGVDPSVAPFSALRYLRWQTDYVFEDDTLFRGNSDALECIYISFDARAMATMEKYNVFSNRRYSKLRNIQIDGHYCQTKKMLSPQERLKFSTSLITPVTRYFGSSSYLPYKDIIEIPLKACMLKTSVSLLCMLLVWIWSKYLK